MWKCCRRLVTAGLAGGMSLLQLGCMSRFISEVDLFTSPNSVGELFYAPRSSHFDFFRAFWNFFDLVG